MEETLHLVDSGINSGTETLHMLDYQSNLLDSSRRELADSRVDLDTASKLLDRMTWAGWLNSAISIGRNNDNSPSLLSVDEPRSDEEVEEETEEETLEIQEMEDSYLLEKVSVLNTMSHEIARKLNRSEQKINDLSIRSVDLEEEMVIVQARSSTLRMKSIKLIKVGAFRLRTNSPEAEYLSVGSNQQLSLSNNFSSSNEWIFYKVEDDMSGRGGLLHVRSQRFLGMDVWGKPVVSARRWNAWEEVIVSPQGASNTTGLFFLARHMGKGEWLRVARTSLGEKVLMLQRGRERVDVIMDKI